MEFERKSKECQGSKALATDEKYRLSILNAKFWVFVLFLCSIVPINRDIFVTSKLSVLNFQKVSLNLTCSHKSSKQPPAPHRLI